MCVCVCSQLRRELIKKVAADNCNFPTDSCEFPTDETTGAQKFNFAPKWVII